MAPTKNYWLLKTEPHTYSVADLKKDRATNWDGVRNFQAKNFLKTMKKGDLALIYHSGDERAVVGLSEVTKSAYPDPDPRKKGDWVQVDIRYKKAFKQTVSLTTLKTEKTLKGLVLLKQSRLSVMPVDRKHFERILILAQHSS